MMSRPGSTSDTEPFAEEAKFFTESRLLQRDVKIVLESVSNQNFVGSVLHPVSQLSVFSHENNFREFNDVEILCFV